MRNRARKTLLDDPAQRDFAELLFGEQTKITPSGILREAHLPARLQIHTPEYLPIFGVKLVRADHIKFDGRAQIRTPGDAARIVWNYLQHCDREQVVAILVDTKGGVIGLNVVSVGDLSSAVVHPREVFKAAILANAASIILTHNHPSGDPTPSPEDVAVSRRIAEGGELLGIDVLDHIVIGDSAARFVSLKEKGLM